MKLLKTIFFLNKRVFIFITFLLYTIFVSLSFLYYNSRGFSEEKVYHYQNSSVEVHIIGKAAIGQFLWLHLFNSSLHFINKGFFQIGNKTFNNILFHYLSGPGYIQNTIPHNIQFLILILNGRTIKHVAKAKQWLEYLPQIHSLKKIAVILLGNERCENQWIMPYMKSKGGIIELLFVVYDSDMIDNEEVFQWPLGVATYRGFPNLSFNNIKYPIPRRYKCNFIGTVYKNSSREKIGQTLTNNELKNLCYLSTRDTWVPNETNESLTEYVNILKNSDFTLSPVGKNAECYRIYEAVTLGSIPIIEDNITPGKCVSSFRLLKKFDPPFIFIKNWKILPDLLSVFYSSSSENIIERRKNLLIWYDEFKKKFTESFVNILKNSFDI